MGRYDIDTDNVVYDIDTEVVAGISKRCSSVGDSLSGATIKVPALVAKYASGVIAAAEGKSEISSAIANLQSTLLGIIASAGKSDISYTDDDGSSDGIRNPLPTPTGMQKADAKFFEAMAKANSDVKIENGVVTIGKYKYNIQSKKLSFDDSKDSSVKVEFYIPQSGVNLSKTNTLTMLAPSGSASMNTNSYFNEYSCNSILVVPYKYNKSYSYTDLKQNPTGKNGNNMTEHVINSTEFITACTNQKSECKNYIIGLSNGGGSALKIGASNTYDGTVVMNYKPLIDGYSSELVGNKGDWLTEADLQSYSDSSKPILFVSSAKDGSKNIDNIALVEDGIEKMLKDKPNINVKWATNNEEVLGSNKSYVLPKKELWDDTITNKGDGVSSKKGDVYYQQYTGHGSFSGMTRDFVNAELFDGNNYNNGTIFVSTK